MARSRVNHHKIHPHHAIPCEAENSIEEEAFFSNYAIGNMSSFLSAAQCRVKVKKPGCDISVIRLELEFLSSAISSVRQSRMLMVPISEVNYVFRAE